MVVGVTVVEVEEEVVPFREGKRRRRWLKDGRSLMALWWF